MDEIIIFVILFVVVIAVAGAVAGAITDTPFRRFRSKLENEFPGTKVHVSHDDHSFLVVDFSNEQIIVGLRKPRGTILAQEKPYRSRYPFSAIVKAEVLRDGTQVASTNRGSQAIGAAVGAVAFGGIGAIIGGLSGSSTSVSGTKRLSIQITVDDSTKPIHEVTFYETKSKKGGKRGDMLFDQGAQQIVEFGAHIEAAIRQSDKVQSLADQIGDLWKLKEVGALTQEEFDAQKARLMNG